MPEPTGMAVSNARDEDMTMFTVRKPVTLAKNRAALVEMFESDLIDARKLVVCGLASYFSWNSLQISNSVQERDFHDEHIRTWIGKRPLLCC
eukprot:TRINITY_DN513_c0_g1_i1.p1 TRINITY_DN513_c0_g1~~TRINITY_DN513_c0_g1_i1.p1  ORF type:complete len:105 (+),score=9.76 TRINITY_DN513_c0_g1_i1:40-315(+)